MPGLSCVVLLALAAVCDAWTAPLPSRAVIRAAATHRVRSATPSLMAKKKSKPRKAMAKRKDSNNIGGGGSGIDLQPPSSAPERFDMAPAVPTGSEPLGMVDAAGASSMSEAPLTNRLDQVLRNAGITPSEGQVQETERRPASPLSKIPKVGQELLERFFGGGAIVFGSAFLLSGIAVAVEAVCKVTGNPLPTPIDEALVQYVEPAMTPSILILFGFSISLGLLKQLQLGSEGTGVLYTEADD